MKAIEQGNYMPGRPPKHNWIEKKQEIEQLIASGYGISRMAKHYGMSFRGMKLVLARLGLRSLGQVVTETAQ